MHFGCIMAARRRLCHRKEMCAFQSIQDLHKSLCSCSRQGHSVLKICDDLHQGDHTERAEFLIFKNKGIGSTIWMCERRWNLTGVVSLSE
jgi:hypothetical protein